MQEYVVGIIHDENNNFVFVRKNRPLWQLGGLNGVGGKVEDGELPYEAMVRECSEECDLSLHNWLFLGSVTDDLNYKVYYYSAMTSDANKASTQTDEGIEIIHLDFLDYVMLIPPTDIFLRLALSPIYQALTLVRR